MGDRLPHFDTVVSVRVWRIRTLTRRRRALPGLLLCAGLAASLSRAAGTTAVAETLAFPLLVATAAIGLFELTLTPAQAARWTEVTAAHTRTRALGGSADDPLARAVRHAAHPADVTAPDHRQN